MFVGVSGWVRARVCVVRTRVFTRACCVYVFVFVGVHSIASSFGKASDLSFSAHIPKCGVARDDDVDSVII